VAALEGAGQPVVRIAIDDPYTHAEAHRRYVALLAYIEMNDAAQAHGDLEVLQARGRRALRIYLGQDVPAGLRALAQAIDT
jgi:hypothetical protein